MKVFLPALALLALPALAQQAPVRELELVPNRMATFEIGADGSLVNLVIEDNIGDKPAPRIAGKMIAVMTYLPEIGTQVEFNSGLDVTMDYKATLVAPAADGKTATAEEQTCPIGSQRVGSLNWPQAYPKVVLSGFKPHVGEITC